VTSIIAIISSCVFDNINQLLIQQLLIRANFGTPHTDENSPIVDDSACMLLLRMVRRDWRMVNKVVNRRAGDGPSGEDSKRLFPASLKRLLSDCAQERALLQALIDLIPDYLWAKDANGGFIAANKALAADCGLSHPKDLIGLSDFDIHPRERAQAFHDVEQKVLRRGETLRDLDDYVETAAGAKRWISTTKWPLRNENGDIVGIIGVGRDVTESKLANDRIRFLSDHDPLTGLPNRAFIVDRLNQAILFAKRHDRWVTIICIDVDNFKSINNTLGYNAGDECLKIIAQRIRSCAKEEDTVVRLGGDEFVVLLVDQPKNINLTTIALQRLREAISQPASIEGRPLRVTSSIGVAAYPDDGTNARTLLVIGEAAMRRAKKIGRDNIQFCTPEINTSIRENFLLEEKLHNALVENDFFLLFQPQIDLRTGRIFGVEALIRWKHPSFGVLSPNRFIPIAEESGLIGRIGAWALGAACKQNKAWQDAGLPPVQVSVNVSARQFQETNWVGQVIELLRESGLDPKYLELELTETLIMENVTLAIDTMKDLQRQGVQLSIDDFGTGYSSLSALKIFPLARLKIDKSFVRDLAKDDNARAVATAVISLGHGLNLRVIAEGVETKAQMEFLRDNNCDEAQGYLFSEPIPPNEMEELLEAGLRPQAHKRSYLF
jgi:diguanylate cyclase (GGDEF)-like protein/PAS domain S-box-containing protein